MADFGKPRPATFEERATWGNCPVCGAKSGQRCLTKNATIVAENKDNWAHFERIDKAPTSVRLVTV